MGGVGGGGELHVSVVNTPTYMTCSAKGDHRRMYKSPMTFSYDNYEHVQRAVCSNLLQMYHNCRRSLVEIRPININVSLAHPLINFQI